MNNMIKLSVVLIFAIAFVSCSEELLKSDYDYKANPEDAPTNVVSEAVSNESAVSALVSGSVPSDANLLDWGVIYYKADSPENFLVKSATDISTSFSLLISGLVPGTSYKFKTYALNIDGITYGSELSFETKPAQSLPFSISTDDPIDIWNSIDFAFIDADGDEFGWEIYDGFGLESYSWYDGPLTPENYVILPPIQLGAENSSISLNLEPGDPGYYEEKYKVIIATAPVLTSEEASAAEVLYEEVLASSDPYTQTIEIPEEYKGKVVWIGIGHYDVTDMYSIIISSITVE